MLKYWLCKRAPAHAGECLECLGGNGYVEESGMPRLFRESPAQLDLGGLRQRPGARRPAGDGQEPRRVEAFLGEVDEARREPRLGFSVEALRAELSATSTAIEARARRFVERMALALQASLLVRFGDAAVADAFCATRLGGDWGQAFGTLPNGADFMPHRRPPPRSRLERLHLRPIQEG